MIKKILGKGIAIDSIWLTVAKLMTSLISIVTSKVLAVEFSLTDYGTYSQGLLIVTTATSLSILGLTDGANLFFNGYKDEEQRQKNVNTVFCIQTVVGTLCAGIIAISSGVLTYYFNNPALTGVYAYIMFMPMLTNFVCMYQVLFVSIGKAKSIAVRNLFVSTIKLAAVVFAALVTKDIITVFIITLISDIAQVLYFSIIFGKSTFWINPFKIDKSKIKEILIFCLPLSVSILTNSLNRDIDKYAISFFTDTESLAIYTNAAKVLPFDMITTSFATVMVPIITKFVVNNQYEKSQNLYKQYLNFSYTTTWMIAFGAVVCSKELMLILYDEKYLTGLGIFIVYILVDMIRFANVSLILTAKRKTKELMVYSIVTLALNFVLNIIFFKLFGLIGPAIATLVVTFGMNCVMLLRGSQIIHSKITQIIDFKDMLKLIVQMLVAAAVAIVIKHFCSSAELNYIITFVLSYGTYAVIIGLLNFKKVLRLFKEINKVKAE